MAKVHIDENLRVHPVNIELDGATPIVPIDPIVIQFGRPQATDEWPIPDAALSLVLDRETAIELALALYQAASARR